jgi:hypothetical protein
MLNKSLKSFGIAHRVLALIALMAISMIALAGIRLVDLRTSLVEQKQNELRQLVESAVAVADSYYKRAQAGEMTMEEAQGAALSAIGAMRYNGSEYFWVIGMQIRPRAKRAMKLICSALTHSEATIRSPSFSRSSSSMRITILPARMSSTSSSMLLRAMGLFLQFFR